MAANTIKQKEWSIPNDLMQKFDEKTLQKFLHSFNKITGGSYFFLDLYREKLVVDTAESRILCDHPKQLAEKEGFAFFKRLLNDSEFKWMQHMWLLASDFFFNLNKNKRDEFILLFDINARTKNNEKRILHFKVVPHQLCNNGNLWLALINVSSSISPEKGRNACIMVHMATSTRYNLVKDEFIEMNISPLTFAEKEMLLLFCKNMLEGDVCKMLKINKNKYHRIKTAVFEKLEVYTPAGAVQRAHQLGLI